MDGVDTLLMLDEQLAITRESVENARRTVEVMEALKEAGMQNEASEALPDFPNRR